MNALRLALAAALTLLSSACIVLPNDVVKHDADSLAQMSEQAHKTCGAGNVKEVTRKGFECK
ncbi:starvation-inducible outer membrane lipoprotein [Inhella inkyongensis]|uniref:Starvation-inducible outer membrane lipoprotein n=1 Tax=Inhella inkyongensis TaxID=392593 RepID=A0A840S8D7_9BURK|nr:hypothetical protein [Inhella inkyongensis]MBB5205276.1 starvation-inducible outer membrane lipoprotein [Inhella inkyongensis]